MDAFLVMTLKPRTEMNGKENDRPIIDFLLSRAGEGRARLHMPGHKGRPLPGSFWKELYKVDLTELHDTDDLNDPCGMIAESQERAARLWGARRSYYLTGSSTAGIIAGVLAAVRTGRAAGNSRPAPDGFSGEASGEVSGAVSGSGSRGASATVLLARNCHKSVFNACDVAGAGKIFVVPDIDGDTGIFSSVTPGQIRDAIRKAPSRPDIVVVTSPTYEGVISDIAGIARVCREEGVPLMVDEAHGAHLGLYDVFAGSAVKAGADIVIQSLHKTLPALTQTGIAHFCSDNAALESEFVRMLRAIQSSSPSYLLTASADSCVRFLESRGEELLSRWKKLTVYARKKLAQYGRNAPPEARGGKEQTAPCHPELFAGNGGTYMTDPAKICLVTPDGTDYLKKLADRGVDAEMGYGRLLLLYTGAGTTRGDVDRAAAAISEIDALYASTPSAPSDLRGVFGGIGGAAVAASGAVMPVVAPYDAEKSLLRDATGRIAAEYVWAYPPGIPLLCPGETVSEDTAEMIRTLREHGARLVFTGDNRVDGEARGGSELFIRVLPG